MRAVDYLAWLALREPNFNRSDILTSETSLIQMASAGILKPKEGATTTITPLIETSAQAAPLDVDLIKMAPDPVSLLANFKPEDKRLLLAARISGPIKSAFPDGAPPEPKPEGQDQAKPAESKPAAAHLAESREPANIIVIADTDLLEDRFWAQVQDFFGQRVAVPIANNGDFVTNAIDNLLGSNALIGLRSRGQSARPFVLVQEIQRDAETRFRAKEKELTEKLRDTEKKLSELQSQGQDQAGGRADAVQGAAGSHRPVPRRPARHAQGAAQRAAGPAQRHPEPGNLDQVPQYRPDSDPGCGRGRAHRARAHAQAARLRRNRVI